MSDTFDTATVLADLTTAEKASLCLGSSFWNTRAIDRLGVPAITMSDGPHGLRRQSARADHVGAGGSIPATCFPTASALGSTWNAELVRAVGEALGEEARALGVSILLGPGINIKRSPLCGRNFEYFAEDPHVSGVLGAAWVDGVQSRGVGASLKHYAVNNQETDRLRVSAEVDERTLREIYLAGFERVVREASPWTVMCSYNKVNGEYASQHRGLLTTILREEWGFEGVVVSDWGAVHDRVAALAAGLDLEMPPKLGMSDAEIVAAVTDGRLDLADLDRAARRVLELVRRAVGSGGAPDGGFDVAGHHELARRAAREGAVLLRNDAGLLPLAAAPGRRYALVGELARTPQFQGTGSSRVNPTRLENILDELRRLLPGDARLDFAAGYRLEPEHDEETDAALLEQARTAARGADAAIVVLGLLPGDESEGYDRTHLQLPAPQIESLRAVAEECRDVVAVLVDGSVVDVSTVEPHAGAILECRLGGQAAGGAIADLLLGLAAPSGRLAETIPVRLQDVPSHLNFPGEEGSVRYGEGVFVGYRGFDATDRPVAYPFGHGLTYTTFGYDDLAVAVHGSADDGTLTVEVGLTVTNTGPRVGQEVVQVYVGDRAAPVHRPPHELRAFAKVSLRPGESQPVTFALGARDFAYWSTGHGWTVAPGTHTIHVGASSRDLRLTVDVELAATPRRVPLTLMSTLDEWIADPVAGAALREAVGNDDQGRPRGVFADAAVARTIGNFPVSSLAVFPNVGFDHATLQDIMERVRISR
ncbi:glycoside hydrolase family 3 C-terminal domain-containing protein [Actinoallomurus acaciae]|uniref:Glycoside hydrolase family 3 C-terminal domain-containing protein n=1 Tax=Actinoallomurus acaciae TaxID=502577 RepID=A0ABV5YW63_9ACTN